MAFVLPLVLSPPGHRPLTKRRRKHVFFALSQSDWLHPSDTLRGFEALCERAQNSFCSAAAAMDGLGTFEHLPDSYPMDGFRQQLQSPHTSQNSQPCRSMKGGRNFEQAVVSVWRSPASSISSRRRDMLHNNNNRKTDGVGLSLRLQPRDSRLPILRANVHYFQLSSGRSVDTATWWFSGAADLSLGKLASPNSFAKDSRVFLNKFRQPLETHRRERLTDAAFLDACLSEEKSDRLAAFAFAGDVLELLLPAYLPLVQHDYNYQHQPYDGRRRDTPENGSGTGNGGEGFERFGLDGGASCESQVTQMAPFAWWSFTVAPRNSSPEGRRFKAMRKGVQPPTYM